MAEIRVTTAELRKQAAELRRMNGDFKKETETLSTQQEQLNGMWDGEANNAFNAAFKSDKVKMDNFHTGIEKYITVLERIADEYDKQEAANLSIASTRK